jgi:hypothetical protein
MATMALLFTLRLPSVAPAHVASAAVHNQIAMDHAKSFALGKVVRRSLAQP